MYHLNLGPPQGTPEISSNFKPVSRTLKNQKKCPQGHQKTPKYHPDPSLGPPNQWISEKSEIIQKQQLCYRVYAHTAIAFWHDFHPWITKNMDLQPVSHFGIRNHRKITKRCPKWLPRDSRNDPKITKSLHLDLQVPVGWPLGSLDHQNGIPGTQNGASRSPK